MIFIPIDKFVGNVLKQLRGYVPEGESISFDLSLICPHGVIDFEKARKIGVCVHCTIDSYYRDDFPPHRNSIQFSVPMNKKSIHLKMDHPQNTSSDLEEHHSDDSQQVPQDKEQEQKT